MRRVFRKLWTAISAISTLQWAWTALVPAVTILGAVALRVLGLGTGWAVTAAVGLALLVVAAALFALTHVRRWFGPRIDLARLADDCERLARDIEDFMAERSIEGPSFRIPTAKTDQGRRRQFNASADEQTRYFQATMAKYQQRFAGRAFALWHDAKAAGLVGESEFMQERHAFERPINSFSIGCVVRVLAVVAQRARHKAER